MRKDIPMLETPPPTYGQPYCIVSSLPFVSALIQWYFSCVPMWSFSVSLYILPDSSLSPLSLFAS